MSTKHVIGSCLCGELAFKCELPSLWAAHCHCTQCQRFHGAAFVTWVGFAVSGFEVTGDASNLKWFDSSEAAARGFCATCGSSVLFRSSRWPEEIHIAMANLHGPIDREPAGHVHADTRVPWIHLSDELPSTVGDDA